MKRTDRYLVGLVIGIVILVIVAFVVTLSKPEAEYQADGSPDAAVHNYLLALQKDDYERAYGYLSPSIVNYPQTLGDFSRDIKNYRWDFRLDENVSLQVQSAREVGDRAFVAVQETRFSGGGLFDSGQYLNKFEMELIQENGDWKIVGGDSYMAYCWTDSIRGCQ